jgi:hypothetical protein
MQVHPARRIPIPILPMRRSRTSNVIRKNCEKRLVNGWRVRFPVCDVASTLVVDARIVRRVNARHL